MGKLVDETGAELDALTLIQTAAAVPTMDELMARDPRQGTPEERRERRRLMVAHFRAERAAYEISEKKKSDKKAAKEEEKEAA